MSAVYPHLPPTEVARRITRQEYGQMIGLGIFEGERVELIRGVIVEMSPQGTPHTRALMLLHDVFINTCHRTHWVRTQMPFAASDASEPEPDLLLVSRSISLNSHPSTASLAIEVAETSVKRDRGTKLALYAEAGIPEYWIVNLISNVVEVHTNPSGSEYLNITIARPGDAILLVAIPDVDIDPSVFLPK